MISETTRRRVERAERLSLDHGGVLSRDQLLTSDPDPVTGRVTSRKCPTCPPRIRVATPVQIEQRDLALTDYEPPATVCVACRRPGPTVFARLDSPLGSAVCDPCWETATSGPGS